MTSLSQFILIASLLSVSTSFTPLSIPLTTGGNKAIYNDHGNPFLAAWHPNNTKMSIWKAIRILNLEFGDRVSHIAIKKGRILINISTHNLIQIIKFCNIFQMFGFEKNGKIKLMNVDPTNVNLQQLMGAKIDLGSKPSKLETQQIDNDRDSRLRKSLCPFVPSACF